VTEAPATHELAALADGALPDRRRAALERRVAGSAELTLALEVQRRALGIVRSVQPEPPVGLRERIEAERARARPRRLGLRRVLASGLAAVVFALVIAVSAGGGDPSLDEAAALGGRSPTSGAPAIEHAGIAFPDWSLEFGWRTAGQRGDEIGGRSARTAVYAKDGTRVAYTIVDGPVLEGTGGPDYVADGRRVVTFERNGHTCVVSAPVAVKREELLELARWDSA
jgi:hypothetical protein